LFNNLRDFFSLAKFSGPVNFGSQEIIYQQVTIQDIGPLSSQDKVAFQAAAGSCRRCLSTVIGLGCPAGNDGVAALFQSFTQEKFQFTGFIASGCKPGLVITLHQDSRTTQLIGESIQGNQGGREAAQYFSW
jgi:hypothetical protein